MTEAIGHMAHCASHVPGYRCDCGAIPRTEAEVRALRIPERLNGMAIKPKDAT